MGVAVGDVMGHGRFDIFVTNFAEDFSTLTAGPADGLFEDVSRSTGIGPMTFRALSWGTAFADLDNDGDLDIVVANGHIYPQIDRTRSWWARYAQRNLLAREPWTGRGADVPRRDRPRPDPVSRSGGRAAGWRSATTTTTASSIC